MYIIQSQNTKYVVPPRSILKYINYLLAINRQIPILVPKQTQTCLAWIPQQEKLTKFFFTTKRRFISCRDFDVFDDILKYNIKETSTDNLALKLLLRDFKCLIAYLKVFRENCTQSNYQGFFHFAVVVLLRIFPRIFN